MCRCFVINLFDYINDFVTFGTQIFELYVDSEIKVYRDIFKKDISFWIYVKIWYENFHCSVIVNNMKEDCVLLGKLRKLQRIGHVLCALCVSSDIKLTEMYGSLKGT